MAGLAAEATTVVPVAQRRRRRLPRSLVVGGALLSTIVVLATVAPLVAPYPYDHMSIASRLRGPSLEHWLGTDEFGRDVLSRVMIGAQPTLYMGFGATAFSLLVGVPLGLIAGYRRGRVDEAIMRA